MILLLIALFGGIAGAQPQKPVENLVGQNAKRWKIGRQFWHNTPRPLWMGGQKGRVLVVDFFRIGCVHCQNAAPSRRAFYQKFHARGVQIVGFQSPGDFENASNPENNCAQVRRTIRAWKLPYPVAFDARRQFFNSYNLSLFPTVLVIDRAGVIRFAQTGYSPEKARELEEFVEKLL